MQCWLVPCFGGDGGAFQVARLFGRNVEEAEAGDHLLWFFFEVEDGVSGAHAIEDAERDGTAEKNTGHVEVLAYVVQARLVVHGAPDAEDGNDEAESPEDDLDVGFSGKEGAGEGDLVELVEADFDEQAAEEGENAEVLGNVLPRTEVESEERGDDEDGGDSEEKERDAGGGEVVAGGLELGDAQDPVGPAARWAEKRRRAVRRRRRSS